MKKRVLNAIPKFVAMAVLWTLLLYAKLCISWIMQNPRAFGPAGWVFVPNQGYTWIDPAAEASVYAVILAGALMVLCFGAALYFWKDNVDSRITPLMLAFTFIVAFYPV